MKKGIALLITIALVAAIAALIGVSTGIIDQAFKRTSNKHFITQTNILFSDFIGILNSASREVTDAMTLDIFFSVPLIFEAKTQDIAAEIAFESDAMVPNINVLVSESNATKGSEERNPVYEAAFEEYLDRILTVYNVSDKILLLALIGDTIDKDLHERVVGSELALTDPFFSQGRLYNMAHFQQILDAYKRQTLDYGVDDIPWEKLIGFRNKKIDFNYVTPEALGFILPEWTPEEILLYTTERTELYESINAIVLDEAAKERFDKLKVVFYTPEVRGRIDIRQGETRIAMSFSYNLSSQRVTDIELFH